MSQNVPLPAKEALQKFISSGVFFKVQELISSLITNDDEVTTVTALMNFKNSFVVIFSLVSIFLHVVFFILTDHDFIKVMIFLQRVHSMTTANLLDCPVIKFFLDL